MLGRFYPYHIQVLAVQAQEPGLQSGVMNVTLTLRVWPLVHDRNRVYITIPKWDNPGPYSLTLPSPLDPRKNVLPFKPIPLRDYQFVVNTVPPEQRGRFLSTLRRDGAILSVEGGFPWRAAKRFKFYLSK